MRDKCSAKSTQVSVCLYHEPVFSQADDIPDEVSISETTQSQTPETRHYERAGGTMDRTQQRLR